MEFDNPEDMVKSLFDEHSNVHVIREIVRNTFGSSPSIKRITQMRREHIRQINLKLYNRDSCRPTSHNAQPMPEGFKELAPTMTKSELQRHYQVKWSGTIVRWLSEAKVEARRYIPARGRINYMGKVQSRGLVTLERVKDPDEVAADILRKERFPVNRCNEDGKFNLTGKWWRVGMNVYTKAELIEKAKKYG